ncbi:MAG: efflux RND transporter periplasmic adaptor subunit [Nitrospirae bacterium]|nr:MAG: efflux RND transporter periplasmic adaptor subunit [Nitrospirota bacterium]
MKKGIFLLIAMMILVVSCSSSEEGVKVERPVVRGVKTEVVKTMEVPQTYKVTATVRSSNTSMVSAKLMGTVTEIMVKTGDRVKKGDLLLRISSPEIKARLRQAKDGLREARQAYEMAKRNLALAEKTYNRFKALLAQKAVSQQEFDEVETKYDLARLGLKRAEAAVKMAEARVREAEAFNAYTLIRSPVTGRVAEKRIDVGSMTAPGMPLFIIEEPRYRVEVPVDESLLKYVRKGMPLKVSIEALGIETEGRVEEISHQIDPATRTFKVKIGLKKIEGLMGGQFARVTIPSGVKKELLVPKSAVVHRGQLTALYVVDEKGVVSLRFVRLGKVLDHRVEVLSGLNPGERIVTEGVEKVQDGAIIKG